MNTHKTVLWEIKWQMIAVCVLLSLNLRGQGDNLSQKPWLGGQFPKVPFGQIYQFKIGRGEGASYTEARKQAVMDFLTSLPSHKYVSSTCRNYLLDHFQNGKTTGETRFECDDEVTQKITSLNARLDENYDQSPAGSHRVQILFAFQDPENHRNTVFDPVTPHYSNVYGWTAGWRSIIIPGWGQLHKKTNFKGIVFLVGVLAASGTTIFFESQRADNFRKSQETTNITFIREFRNRADSAALARNIGISVAGGLWVWSVIDALNTKGALKYDYGKTARFYASNDGITLGISF